MHEQRCAAVSTLRLVMPHPSLPHRRSSMLSSVSDPHTPPPRNSPLPMLSSSSNRKSSDSWNSSVFDGADDPDWEWKPEQTRLLSRTLDALPAHLLTPFNGPVPPSNLLDKIAKGVTQAKGPAEWPHSLRATRAKIVELARLRSKEDTASDTIAEEESTDPDIPRQTTSKASKRPLHRQSSMDFMKPIKLDPADDSITRLSHRLQHTERMIPNPAYHPYACTSPLVRAGTRTLASSASSTTLNSESSCGGSASRIPRLRRSLSSISNSSESYIQQPSVDPRVQRIRRTESFAGSALYPPGSPLKCVPSFGSLSKRNSDAMSVDCSNRSDVTTSDEEEKLRSKRAKKPRVKAASPTPATSSARSPSKPQQTRRTTKQLPKPTNGSTPNETSRRVSRPKVNLQRNPSILGPELPCVTSAPSEYLSQSPTKSRAHRRSPSALSANPSALRTRSLMQTPAPSSPARKASRRITPPLSRPGRKISFGTLTAPEDPELENGGLGIGLGLESAFQIN